jgi:glutathione-regulated potassium-efflux system ancillary protein KefC
LLVLPLQGVLFFILFLMSGLRARTAFVSSIALMTYSEFALITTEAMVKAGFLSAEWKSIISLAVAGSLAIAAQLNRFSHRLFALCESTLAPFERKSRTPDHLPVTIGKAEWLVLGMGRTGVAAYLTLHQENKPVIGLDADPIVLKKVIGKGLRVVYGDAEDAELWRQLPLDRVKGVVLTMPDYNARHSTIELLRNTGYIGQIGTICFNADEKLALEKRGASFVIHPLYEAGCQLAKQLIS